MTIVHFPKNIIQIEYTAANFNTDTDRWYMAAKPPHRLVIIVTPEVAALGPVPDVLQGNFDCSLGNHTADAPIGYTLPQYAGQPHSKITIRREVDDDPEMTWQDVLDGCPTSAESQFDWRLSPDVWTTDIAFPPQFYQLMIDYCALHDISIDQAIWMWALEELS